MTYSDTMCPNRFCFSLLIVELDSYTSPTVALIKCPKCGAVVMELWEKPIASSPFLFVDLPIVAGY